MFAFIQARRLSPPPPPIVLNLYHGVTTIIASTPSPKLSIHLPASIGNTDYIAFLKYLFQMDVVRGHVTHTSISNTRIIIAGQLSSIGNLH